MVVASSTIPSCKILSSDASSYHGKLDKTGVLRSKRVELSQIGWNGEKRRGLRKRCDLVVAASPPTEDAVVDTEPLTKEDLVNYLVSGCKPKDKWR